MHARARTNVTADGRVLYFSGIAMFFAKEETEQGSAFSLAFTALSAFGLLSPPVSSLSLSVLTCAMVCVCVCSTEDVRLYFLFTRLPLCALRTCPLASFLSIWRCNSCAAVRKLGEGGGAISVWGLSISVSVCAHHATQPHPLVIAFAISTQWQTEETRK